MTEQFLRMVGDVGLPAFAHFKGLAPESAQHSRTELQGFFGAVTNALPAPSHAGVGR